MAGVLAGTNAGETDLWLERVRDSVVRLLSLALHAVLYLYMLEFLPSGMSTYALGMHTHTLARSICFELRMSIFLYDPGLCLRLSLVASELCGGPSCSTRSPGVNLFDG